MKTYRLVSAGIILIISLACLQPVMADRGRGKNKNWKEPERYKKERTYKNKYREDKNYRLDNRYKHNRYYPKRGYVVKELPPDRRIFKHHQDHYYFNDGIWYRPSVGGFIVITPPIGLVVPFLPAFYTTIWVGRNPYYYADGVYYLWRPEDRVYVVTDPPPEEEVIPETNIPDKLFVYPKKGQSAEQQATDRYECHRWSVEQTGFDPTKAGGDVPAGEHAAKQLDYQRALKACLEARDYSVK